MHRQDPKYSSFMMLALGSVRYLSLYPHWLPVVVHSATIAARNVATGLRMYIVRQ